LLRLLITLNSKLDHHQKLAIRKRFAKAASYALHREEALRVFLDHPGVDIDTNKDERALRPIPMVHILESLTTDSGID
jgi:hypothetical protein